ncbi:Solute carrier family 25 member 45 [Pseudolycoriella hygida]|uniref:Solute carrier family 25 member 45 n=1 Tax=Pseudolycoriella hygida TaxID=35572 RepID=A0A9Q0MXQ5_9DIPT|nr:Solute carrier family 25 member 45 [Pseudolycoriella hygida]
MTFPLLTTGAINTLFFGIYGNELRNLQNDCSSFNERQEKWGRHVLYAGSMAGLVQSFIACPTELVTIRLQTRNYYLDYRRGHRRGPIACIKTIFQSDGLAGFYRGLAPTLCRDVIPYGIYMLAYEKILQILRGTSTYQSQQELDRLNEVTSGRYELLLTSLSGAIAGLLVALKPKPRGDVNSYLLLGVLSWIIAIPFDVLKTIMQADAATKYESMFNCIKINFERHGWTFLFRGSWIIVVRAIPVNCATFIGYEYVLNKCKIFNKTSDENKV